MPRLLTLRRHPRRRNGDSFGRLRPCGSPVGSFLHFAAEANPNLLSDFDSQLVGGIELDVEASRAPAPLQVRDNADRLGLVAGLAIDFVAEGDARN